MLTPAVSIWTKCGTTMCCNEFVLFDLQQQTRNQFCKWPHSNNEHWKSVVFKFVSVRQAFLFNADRITYNVECAWYQLSTRIQWKLHWYFRSRDRSRGMSWPVLYLLINSLWITITVPQNYTHFIVTVWCIGVSIYCNGEPWGSKYLILMQGMYSIRQSPSSGYMCASWSIVTW